MDNQVVIKQGWPLDLSEISDLLNSSCPFDTITPALLYEKLLQDPEADPDLCLTAYLDDVPVGFLFGVMRNIRGELTGYIKLLAVSSTHRRKKIGSQLYKKAETLLKGKGATIMRIYDVPLNYFMPGIDPRYTEAVCFAFSHGFKRVGDAINMIVDLNAMDWSTDAEEQALLKKNVQVRRATAEDLPLIRQLLEAEWQLWNFEVDMAMSDDPPSVHIAFIDGNLRAFSVHNGNNKGTGWFGPMGTHPDMRGMGVGSILLKRCLEDMRLQGHQQAIIPWVGPIAFYSHYAAARINRVFWRMEKELED
jgi:mycothiol synthase